MALYEAASDGNFLPQFISGDSSAVLSVNRDSFVSRKLCIGHGSASGTVTADLTELICVLP